MPAALFLLLQPLTSSDARRRRNGPVRRLLEEGEKEDADELFICCCLSFADDRPCWCCWVPLWRSVVTMYQWALCGNQYDLVGCSIVVIILTLIENPNDFVDAYLILPAA